MKISGLDLDLAFEITRDLRLNNFDLRFYIFENQFGEMTTQEDSPYESLSRQCPKLQTFCSGVSFEIRNN